MMSILLLARQYHTARANFDSGVMYKPLGMELGGKVLGIIGFGASGQALARRARSFGLRIQASLTGGAEPLPDVAVPRALALRRIMGDKAPNYGKDSVKLPLVESN